MSKKFLSALLSISLMCQPCVFYSVYASEEDFKVPAISESSVLLDQKIKEFKDILKRYSDANYTISENDLIEIFDMVRPVLASESSLLRVNGPTIIVGDVHGDLNAVSFCCEKFLDEINAGSSIVFLGDYVDRGPDSIKCIALLFRLKIMFPDKVFLLRGNHEDPIINTMYGFCGECKEKYGNDKIFEIANLVFNYLPLAALINDKTFCVHGGIGPEVNIDSIEKLERPIDPKACHERDSFIGDMLWSDPSVEIFDFDSNYRGAGCQYGEEVVKEFLTKHGLDRIVRAHEFCKGGFKKNFKGKVVTVFSAPDYCGRKNEGKITKIDGNSIIRHSVGEKDASWEDISETFSSTEEE